MVERRIVSSFSIALAVMVIAVAIAVGSCTPTEQMQIVARVGGEAITSVELLEELRKRRGAQMLVDIIDTQLIHQAAEEAGISVSTDEMDLRWKRAIAEAGSQTDMEAIFERRGLTEAEYRRKLRDDLLLDKLAKATIQIPDQEIQDFYREHKEDYALGERTKARMILVSSEADAKALREALDDPEADFAGLAKALSIDPATKDEGGAMGWFERDDYARAITDVAFEMEAVQISDPIEVPDGWVLLKIEGHKEAGYEPLDEVRNEIRARIEREKLRSAREAWMRSQREQAAVQIHDEDLREGVRVLLETAPPPQRPSLLPVPPPG